MRFHFWERCRRPAMAWALNSSYAFYQFIRLDCHPNHVHCATFSVITQTRLTRPLSDSGNVSLSAPLSDSFGALPELPHLLLWTVAPLQFIAPLFVQLNLYTDPAILIGTSLFNPLDNSTTLLHSRTSLFLRGKCALLMQYCNCSCIVHYGTALRC